MPIFGDYETIGEPLAVINLQGHASTVWKVRKAGAPEGVEWVVKCYVPHRKPGEAGDEGSLHRDRGLEFLEGVKQVKKVHSGGGARQLTPIHDLGISPDGVWYITDYYPRGSLQALVGRRAKVDDAALKQIVRCIVAGCLALKRSRGFSHGNLKASNVFLVGKPQPLPKTPMVLGDAYPASALQMARLDTQDRREVDELLHQVMEVQDLHSLGEIILQLVERRQIRSGYDYNYPISRSDFWDSLGKEGESWRQFCNQLLDPQLSLAGTNFESLAKKFPPPGTGNNLLVITSVVAGLCLLGGGIYGFTVWNTKHHRQNYNDSVHAAQQALQNGDFLDAKQKIADALKWEPQDAAALNLSQEIGNRIEKEYALLVVSADEKFKAANWDQALGELNKAFSLKPDGVEARDLKEKIEQAQQSQARQQTEEQQFQAALENGKARFAAGDYAGAMAQADEALKLKPNDAEVLQFKTEVRIQRDASESAQQQQHELAAALESGRARLAAGDYAGAMAQADAALNLKPNDETALHFKQSVRAQWDAAYTAQQQSKYAEALQKGKALLAGGDYEGAMAQADTALTLKPNDATALQFKQSVQTQRDAAKVAQQQLGQYAAALQKGKTLLAAGDFAAAMTQADAALTLKPNDEAVMQFKKDVRAQWDAAYEAQQQSKYTAALQKGKTLLAAGDYAGAIAQADTALSLKPNDATALQFKQSVQTQWDAAKAAQQRLGQYAAALQKGKTLLAAGDYAGAITQADTALTLKPNDATALQFKESVQTQWDTAKAAQRQQSQYVAALENGRARLATGDYAGALTQADTALSLKPNDATALQFKQRVQTQWDAAKAAQQQQSQYAAALQNGNTLLAAGDYAGALTQADAALAMNVPDTSGAERLKSQAMEKVDFKNATDDFNQGKYDEALALCSRHSGVSNFDDLGRNISAEKGDFDSARASFEQGDYSFIEKVAKYQGKSSFADLLTQARPQADTFQKLESLTKNSANWVSVKNTLNDPSNSSFINKAGFTPFRTWVQQHDPAVALNRTLSLCAVWFGVNYPDKGIVDPNTGKPAEKLGPGVDLAGYYTLLDNLGKQYSSLGGDQSANLNLIKKIEAKMNNWP